ALSGFTVYLDANNNKKKDGNERSTTTDGSGHYRFTNLSAGTYQIRVVLKPGYRQTKPSDNGGHTVNLGNGQNLDDRGFGVTRRASISGTVFRDGDHDGKFDSSESGLGGRK